MSKPEEVKTLSINANKISLFGVVCYFLKNSHEFSYLDKQLYILSLHQTKKISLCLKLFTLPFRHTKLQRMLQESHETFIPVQAHRGHIFPQLPTVLLTLV